MSGAQSLSTNDLRSASIDYKRFHDAQKWKHGVAFGPGRGNLQHGKPAKLTSRSTSPPAWKPRGQAIKVDRKRDMLSEQYQYATSDSSADEDVNHHSAVPTPGTETVYFSFDSKTGPSRGSQVLNAALAKAIDTFETSTTEKIVKEEYDVLDQRGESVGSVRGRRDKKGCGSSSSHPVQSIIEDEDYEFV